MKIIVSGTRHTVAPSEVRAIVENTVDQWCWCGYRPRPELVIGDCPTGVDAVFAEMRDGPGLSLFGADWRGMYLSKMTIFEADWAAHGKKAGPIRNSEMISYAADDSKVLLLAFPCIHSKGTVDMITKAAKAAFAIRSYPVKCNHAAPVLT